MPIRRRRLKMLDALGGVEMLYDMVAGGATVRGLCRELGISPPDFYAYLDLEPGRRALIEEARRVFAEELDVESQKLADEAVPEREQIQKTKLQIETRKHRAAMADRSRQEKGAEVNVSFGVEELHLTAVKSLRGEVVEADFEIEEEEEDG